MSVGMNWTSNSAGEACGPMKASSVPSQPGRDARVEGVDEVCGEDMG